MKKLFFTLALSLLVTPAFAQDNIQLKTGITLTSSAYTEWYLDEGIQSLGIITISGTEAFAGNTFALKIAHEFPMIFNKNLTLTINNQSVAVTYSATQNTVYFTAPNATEFSIEGLQVRIYGESANFRGRLLLDLDADNIFDAQSTNEFDIKDNSSRNESDTLKPEAVPNLAYNFTATGIQFTWTKPVDLDVRDIFVQRTKNGAASELFWNQNNLSYLDTDLKNGDVMEYKIYARDLYYWGEVTSFSFTVELAQAPAAEEVPVVETPAQEQTQNQITELSQNPTRTEIQSHAQNLMDITNPLTRLKTLKIELKKLQGTDRIWLMRYAIQIIEARKK